MQVIADLPHEQKLVARAKQGDAEAFCTLYLHYLPRLHDYVAYRVVYKRDIEDIVAGVFTRVVECLSQFEYRQEGSFAAWLFTITSHEVATFYRKAKKTGENISLDELPNLQCNTLSPEQMVLLQERFMYLQRLIRTLSPRRQEVVRLRIYGGLRNEEIATVLGMNKNTVASHFCQALEELKTKYTRMAQQGPEA